MPRKKILLSLFVLGPLLTHSLSSSSTPRLSDDAKRHKNEGRKANDYAQARAIRIAQGQTAVSEAIYRDLLSQKYPNDCTTASHLAATSSTPHYQREVAAQPKSPSDYRLLQWHLKQANYTNQRVGSILLLGNRSRHRFSLALSPIYVTPAAAGTLDKHKVESQPQSLTRTPAECLVALFLLGATVSYTTLRTVLGADFVNIAESLSILYPSDADPTRAMGTVQIFPLQVVAPDESCDKGQDGTLYIMTDWHPRVLSQTKVGPTDGEVAGEEPVMYIGPDSLGLVQHFWSNFYSMQITGRQVKTILDLCTGSGIQALYGLALYPTARATCVDISTRALHFVLINALLNDIDPSRLDLVEGDLLTGMGRRWSIRHHADEPSLRLVPGDTGNTPTLWNWLDSSSTSATRCFDVITANPPFLPVPPDLVNLHGKFSDGGDSGEEALAAIVRVARRVLANDGILAIVSEFFLSSSSPLESNASSDTSSVPTTTTCTGDKLLERIQGWWWNSNGPDPSPASCCRGFLLTNEFPIDRETYATRRADSEEEFSCWIKHLERIDMTASSPGFLFIKKKICTTASSSSLTVHHAIAPRSSYGSLWTPSNPTALAFSEKLLDQLMNKE